MCPSMMESRVVLNGVERETYDFNKVEIFNFVQGID